MITLNDIINFIQKAINKYKEISSYDYETDNHEEISFYVEPISICIYPKSNYFTIRGHKYEYLKVKHEFTEREILEFKNLVLSVNELNATRAENLFKNFFIEDANKPADIYDLDDEEDK